MNFKRISFLFHQGISFVKADKLLDPAIYDWIIRIALAALFIGAGFIKINDPAAFAVVIKAFGILPESFVKPVSVGLPILELTAGYALLFNVRFSLHAVTGLLMVFMAILVYGIHLGLDIDCGCYGPEDPESRGFGGLRTAFYRDLIMCAGIAYLYARSWYILKTSHPSPPKEESHENP